MDLVRDLMDQQLVDREGRNIGRVDDLIVEIRDGAPPRVVAMEIGSVTLARRIHPRLARWWRRFGLRWLPVSIRAVRIPLHTIRDMGIDVELDVDADEDRQLLRGEKWLVRHVLSHLPGGH